MKTVVLGGYGNFGARICRDLASCPEIELIVAGRNLERAEQLAKTLGPSASAAMIDLDNPELAHILRSLGTGLVIHTAGPFQTQGYKVAFAAASAGAHYIDLADGRRFVCDFPSALDAAFRKNARFAVTGASTLPALSSAVIDSLTNGWQQLTTIDMCIAPAQTAPRGEATMAAVLDYCGAPIEVWQDGGWATHFGWSDLHRVEFARLAPRVGAVCDVPDLELFRERYPGVQGVMFRAALEIAFAQRSLAVVARLRRSGLIRRPGQLANLLNITARGLDCFGSSLGGMVVRVSGIDGNGSDVARSWHIAADHDHGPEIPCMAASLLARRLARNDIAAIGAYTSAGWLNLGDFSSRFAQWGMVTDTVEEGTERGT